jgi:SRSO17 transposase
MRHACTRRNRVRFHSVTVRCPSRLWRRIACTAPVTSRPCCAKRGKGYVLGVAVNHVFRSWGKKQLIGGTAAKIAQSLAKSAWRRLSSGEGTKGPRLHDWAYLELADLDDVAQYNSTLTGQWTEVC